MRCDTAIFIILRVAWMFMLGIVSASSAANNYAEQHLK